jgi:hypothetical protein
MATNDDRCVDVVDELANLYLGSPLIAVIGQLLRGPPEVARQPLDIGL